MKACFRCILVLIGLLGMVAPARADKAPPAITLTGQSGSITAVAFSPDGKLIASTSDQGSLKIWDVSSAKERFSFDGICTNKNQIRWTPDAKSLVTMGRENNVLVFDAVAGKVAVTIPVAGLEGGPEAIDLSQDGKNIAVVGRSTLRIYDIGGGDPKYAWEVHKEYSVPAVAFSPDGSHVATASTDDSALVLEPQTGKIVQTFQLALKGGLVLFSGDGKKLLVYSTDGVVSEFDIQSGQSRKILDKGVAVETMGWSADGKKLLVGGMGRAPWFVSTTGNGEPEDLYDSDNFVKAAAVSADGKWLAGGANEGSVYLWKIAN